MKKRKGSLLQRMMAVLLSAVLVAGMLSNAAPVTVLAQETDGQHEDADRSGAETTTDDTKQEEKTETTPAEGTGSEGQEKTDPEGQEEPGTTEDGEMEDGDDLTDQEPGGGMEEKPQEPVVAPQSVMMAAAPAPQAGVQRDVTVTFKIYGYNPDKFPMELNNVVAIWSKNAEEFIEGEENKKAVTEEGYTCWSYTFRNLDVNTRYDVKEKNALGQMYTIPTGSGTEYERIDYAVNFYDGNELKGVQYVTSGNHAWEDSAPVLTKDDCTFAGWVTENGGSTAFDFGTAITQVTDVYASWTPNTPSSANIASGDGYVLDADGRLTIKSDNGMASWLEIRITALPNDVTKCYYNLVTSVEIQSLVTSIGMNAFASCSSLTEITIPKSVKSIGEGAFAYCSKLTGVTMQGEMPPIVGDRVFTDCGFVKSNTQGIHVPEGKAQTYKEASDNWKKWEAYITDGTAPTETHEHNDVPFTAWTATDSLPDAAGNYYLTEDVTLTDTWKVPGETNLCLNGKTISASGTDEYRVITIPESCTLHLYDCQNAGNITGGKEGGVINFGTFNMYGGKISGNEGEVSGGGVNNQGIFRMYGGEISGNRADNFGDYGCVGGGVYIGDGTFAMYGGKISGNTASTGGGVGSVSVIGTFLTIIYDEPLTIGGGAEVNGNTCDGKENNVCLNDGQIITIESDNPLSTSAKIGVTTKTAPTDGSPVNITEKNGADYSSFFTSDNADYKIVNGESNMVQLAVKAQAHIHNLIRVDAKPATCTEDGKEAYYHCDGCDKFYEDEAGTRLIADISTWGNIAALGHDWGEWTVTKPATAAKPGERERTCKRCNEKETETIPKKGGGSGSGGNHSGDSGDAGGGNNHNGGDNGSGSFGGNGNAGGSTGNTGGTGASTSKTPGAAGTGQPRIKQEKEENIRKEVRVEGENTLDAAVETPLSELADIVLTKEEKQKAADGTDVKIVLDVKDASAVVSASDKALVEKALNGSLAKGYTLGQYLDINLFKVIGDSRSAITETNRKIIVTIDVPDSLKNADSTMTRTFAVIRVHNGKAEFLPDLDHNANTITIETDRFSTYAVVYKDTAGGNSGSQSGNGKPGVVRVSANSDGKNPGGGKDGEPKTGDNTPLELYATLAMIAGFAYLLLYFADRERGMTEETKKELVSRIVGWAKQGGKIRKWLALAAIFALLVYYHSIGKKTCAEWKAIYGE